MTRKQCVEMLVVLALAAVLGFVLAALAAGCASPGVTEPPAPEAAAAALPFETGRVIRAVCVGWNRVDPVAYDGWDGRLTDCELDAELWAGVWRESGIETTLLLTEQATIAAVHAALKHAVRGLAPRDELRVCISGHGGQDGGREFVCAWDGRVFDTTINGWLRNVPAGVRVLWICDTCHSGDMYRTARPFVFRREALRDFFGELILLAGCGPDGKSLSTGQGGVWSTALQDTGPHGQSPASWFEAARGRVPADMQVPVLAEYGAVSAGFRDSEVLNRRTQGEQSDGQADAETCFE